MIVIPGPASVELGKQVASWLKAKVLPVEFKRFSDGESYIRFDGDVKGENVVIVQTTGPPQNENVIQLLLMADNANDLGAKNVIAVVPYFAYARQDTRFRPGEAFSVRTLVKLLQNCGVSRIITVNAHNPAVLKTLQVRIEDLSAIPLLAGYFKDKGYAGVFSLGLGKKGLATAMEAAKIIEGSYGYIPTKRHRLTGTVTLEESSLKVKGESVIIFDDIISSGGTMIKAVAWVRERGARKINVACVHPLLTEDVKDKIVKSGAETVVGTDSVPSRISVVSLAKSVADALTK